MRYSDESVYLIAEIGMNHEGSFGQAKMLIKAAAESGANSVKFQMHISEEETIKNAPRPKYFTEESRYDYFNRTAFTIEQWKELKAYSNNLNMDFMVSPFSIKAAEMLEGIGVDVFKIASGEVNNFPLVEYVAKTGIPVVISSGMSNYEELDEAIELIKKHNSNSVYVMQCTSEYPCKPENIGLNLIKEYKERYNIPVGFSDHTLDNWASVLAVYEGATMIERHFTLSKKMYGPDAKMSLEPEELKELSNGLKFVLTAKSSKVDKNNIENLKFMRETFQKSIVANCDIQKGEVITYSMLGAKKPGTGINPKYIDKMIGKKANKNISFDDILNWEDVE